MENKILKLATPISHLFNKEGNAKKIVDVSDCLECRDRSLESSYKNQEVFHCDLQPIHSLSEDDFNYLEKIKKTKNELKLISFHMASCYNTPQLKDGKFVPRGTKVDLDTLKKNAEKNFSIIKQLFGNRIVIAVENNNYYKTEAYDYVTQPKFISDVVKQNGINFLLDTAHAKIASFNQGVGFENYMNQLPLDQLIQIHISRPGYNKRNEIIDKHDLPGEKEVDKVFEIIKSHNSVKYLTVEYYQDTDLLIQFINYLKLKINEQYFS